MALGQYASGQKSSKIDEHGVYRNTELGFSFTTPSGLRDVTSAAGPSEKPDPNTVALLLFELSGPNSDQLDWRGMAVQSYPRDQVSTTDDFEAETRMSKTIIGNKVTETVPPTKVTIKDLAYALSRFQRTHGVVTEYSHVYTTIIHGHLVAFAFTANAESQAEAMAEVLKTVEVKAERSSK